MSQVKKSIVVLSAARFEAEATLAALSDMGLDTQYVEVGIGALESAKRSQLVSERCRGQISVFVGSCGTFGAFETPEIVEVNEVHWLPTCERIGLGYRVAGTDPPQILFNNRATLNLRVCKAVCSPTISLSGELSSSFNPHATVENLELYSVVKEIAQSSQKFCILLGVTNKVGPNAHEQWKSNFKNVSTMTSQLIRERIQSII